MLFLPSLAHTFRTSHNYSSAGKQLIDVFIMGNGLWFLMAFFVGEVVMYGITTLFHHQFPRGGVLVSGIVLIVLSFVNDSGLYRSVVLPFQIIKGLQIAGFMAIGYVMRKKLLGMLRSQAIPLMVILIVVYTVFTVIIVDFGSPAATLWILKMAAAVSGAIGCTALCIIIGNNPLLARIGRDSLVFYAVNALSLNVAKLVMFRFLQIGATHWTFIGQLGLGLVITAFAMLIMFAVNILVQRYFWWSIGKSRPANR